MAAAKSSVSCPPSPPRRRGRSKPHRDGDARLHYTWRSSSLSRFLLATLAIALSHRCCRSLTRCEYGRSFVGVHLGGLSCREAPCVFNTLAETTSGSLDANVTRRGLVVLFGGGGVAGLDSPLALAIARDPEERRSASIFAAATSGVVSVARKLKHGEKRLTQDGLPPTLGSGFVWDRDVVVTNWHVIKDVDPRNVVIIFLRPDADKLEDERLAREVVPAKLVGADPATDVAVLRVSREQGGANQFVAKPLARGVSSQLEVGQNVFAIGNPFGLDHSMSRGIISGISRTLDVGDRPIRGCIQTDASINPGNSGGPLLDSQGLVIGINTAILTGSRVGTSAGVGLAVPIASVTRAVQDILEQGYVRRPYLGIVFADDAVSRSLLLPGIVVVAVIDGSPAEVAGMRSLNNGVLGDVVVAIDNRTVRTGADFYKLLDTRSPGDEVALTVQRARGGFGDGVEQRMLNITLAAAPS